MSFPLKKQDVSFLLTPLREGRPDWQPLRTGRLYFYSRPCGRGDVIATPNAAVLATISTHAPAGGATSCHLS